MQRAIILAAGLGSRLVHGKDFPKPLHPVAGVPLIARVIRNLEQSGVDEAVVVVGYLGDVLMENLSRYSFDCNVRFVRNEQWDKPNGTSLLAAKEYVTGPTFLVMSDHLWSPGVMRAVAECPMGAHEVVLGVDYGIERCFDLDDATKVRVDNGRIVAIGKELKRYNALDTGVFCISPALMSVLESVDGPEGCSLSQGIAELAMHGYVRPANIGAHRWIDVDTPEAYTYAEKHLDWYEEVVTPQVELPSAPSAPRVRALH